MHYFFLQLEIATEQLAIVETAVSTQAEERDCMQEQHEADLRALRNEHDAKVGLVNFQ